MYMSYLQWFYILISANAGYRKSQIFSLVWFSYPINFVCVVFWKRNDVGVDFKPKTHKCQFNCNEDRSVSQKFRYTKRNDAVAANFRRPWKDEKPLTMLVPIFNKFVVRNYEEKEICWTVPRINHDENIISHLTYLPLVTKSLNS